MTATEPPQYRQLALDSSNDLIRHDARRSDRRYTEAALHVRAAGLARLRMGELMRDAGDSAQAAADWLSAAACFYLATDAARMADALSRVKELYREGQVPTDRRDIHAALKEREEQERLLGVRLQQFRDDYERLVGPGNAANPEALGFLLQQVKGLPRLAFLHASIASQAGRLGQKELAVRHLDWAEQIEPGEVQLRALRAALQLASPDREKGLQNARDLLRDYPDIDELRLYYALALISKPGGRDEDWNQALAVLQPLLREEVGDIHTRLGAVALAALYHYRTGNDVEYRRALATFTELSAAAHDPDDLGFVVRLRRDFPQVFPTAAGAEASDRTGPRPSPIKPDYSAVRKSFERFALSVA